MSKALFLVFCCVLVSCLAAPSLDSWLRDRLRPRPARGCRDAQAARQACGADSTALAPHPRDCRLFYYCRGAAPPACRHCPFGLHFNPALQVCDWPQHANCTVRPPPSSTASPPSTGEPSSTSAVPEPTATPDKGPSSSALTDSPSSTDPSSLSTDAPSSDPYWVH